MVCQKRYKSSVRLDGKTAIITGCNTGIGKPTVKDFYERGARVIMACRNKEKANEAANDIKSACETKPNLGEIIVEELDLSSLESIRNFSKNILEKEPRIDLLVNNAGVFATPEGKTEDGFEIQFGTNHLGHFLLTLLLLPKILQSPAARIVSVSSALHSRGTIDLDDVNFNKRSYSPTGAYYQSKLANILFTAELAKRLKEKNITNVTTYSLHPGVIATEINRDLKNSNFFLGFLWGLMSVGFKTPEEGAQATIYCSIDEKCSNESGLYYEDRAVKTPSKAARNGEDANRLWELSLSLVGLPENYDPFIKS